MIQSNGKQKPSNSQGVIPLDSSRYSPSHSLSQKKIDIKETGLFLCHLFPDYSLDIVQGFSDFLTPGAAPLS